MKTAIVTGADGFVGSHLIRTLLEKNVRVIAVVRSKNQLLTPPPCGGGLTLVECAMKDYSHLHQMIEPQADVFYHLAWNGVYGASFKDYHQQLDNAAYAADALMAAVQLHCNHFVLVGTVNQLEAHNYMLAADCHPRYTCIYATAKLAAEMICKTLAYQTGITFHSAMLAMIFGEGDRSEMLPKVLMRSLLTGQRPKLVEGNQLYDWIYIGDVAQALYAIGERGLPNKTYYVGHRKLKKFRDIILEVRDCLNPGMELIFGEYPDELAIDYSKIDLDALWKDTGFECCSDFKQTIQQTADWLLEQENLSSKTSS